MDVFFHSRRMDQAHEIFALKFFSVTSRALMFRNSLLYWPKNTANPETITLGLHIGLGLVGLSRELAIIAHNISHGAQT